MSSPLHHKLKIISVCAGLLMAFIHAALAAGAQADFDAANKLYEQGKFAEAAAAYDKVLTDGHRSAAVFYNLGTACYKAGQMGRAIAAYRQAELLSPRDASLRANLQFVRKRVNGEDKSPVPLWKNWLSLFTINEGSGLAAAAFWGWMLLLAAGEFKPALKPRLRRPALAAAAATVLFVACLAGAAYVRFAEKPAVVVVREAVVRYGPLDESQTAFQLPDGSEVVVLDAKDDWLQVRDTSKRVGWLKRNQVFLPGSVTIPPVAAKPAS